MTPTLPPTLSAPSQTPAKREEALRTVAVELEASFLAEMLKHAGLGSPREGLGSGGAGEDAFASMMTQEYASRLAQAGGIGIAEHLFQALVTRDNTA